MSERPRYRWSWYWQAWVAYEHLPDYPLWIKDGVAVYG